MSSIIIQELSELRRKQIELDRRVSEVETVKDLQNLIESMDKVQLAIENKCKQLRRAINGQ